MTLKAIIDHSDAFPVMNLHPGWAAEPLIDRQRRAEHPTLQSQMGRGGPIRKTTLGNPKSISRELLPATLYPRHPQAPATFSLTWMSTTQGFAADTQ